MMKTSRKESAFTLIEIVIVLALASILLAVVLMAVNGAQQASRDAQRRNAVSQVESALEQWALTHSNSYASSGKMVTVSDLYGACGSGTAAQYLDCGVVVPGTGAQFASGPTTGPTAANQISITDRSATYSGTCGSVPGSCSNGYCVTVMLEAGNNEIYGSTDTNKVGRNMSGANYCK